MFFDPDLHGDEMKKIMFVCHGNICRSPMAEFVFKKMMEEKGVSNDFYVSSCATSSEEIYCGVGNPVYPPAKAELKKHGISCEGKRAVQLKKSDYDLYDFFVCMDDNNTTNAYRIFGADSKSKIVKLMNFTIKRGNVADPWYTGDFEKTYTDICEGCSCLLKFLLDEKYST